MSESIVKEDELVMKAKRWSVSSSMNMDHALSIFPQLMVSTLVPCAMTATTLLVTAPGTDLLLVLYRTAMYNPFH